jgi:hypothetical protein
MNLLGKAFQKIRAWVGLADASDSRLTPGHGWLLPVPVDARLRREDETTRRASHGAGSGGRP